MSFPIDEFPHSDYHSLDARYWLTQFERIQNDWRSLYEQMVSWKDTTTEELETWKNTETARLTAWQTEVENNISSFEDALTSEQTEWFNNKTTELNTWKANFETLFNTTFSNLTQIKTDAEAARDAAIAAKTGAETAAEEAEAVRQGLENVVEYSEAEINILHNITWIDNYSLSEFGTRNASNYFHYTDAIPVKEGEVLTIAGTNPGIGTSYMRVIGYPDNSEPIDTGSGGTPTGTQLYVHSNIAEDYESNIYIPSGINFIRCSIRKTEENSFLRRGGIKSSFEIYGTHPIKVRKKLDYAGKYISILGGSISTYEGYIPEGYSDYYPDHAHTRYFPVKNVEQTYWMKVINALGANLLVNNSSAGSFCTTYGGVEKAGCGDRATALHTAEHDPDIIIIQLGGNDFTRGVQITSSWDGTGPIPDYSTLEISKFDGAYPVMLDKITKRYKKAIVCCGLIPIICNSPSYVKSGPPCTNMDNVTLREYNDVIIKYARLFNCRVIDWESCGFTYYNPDLYMQDYGQHPNKYGHTLMAKAVLKCLGLPETYIEEVFEDVD